MDITILICTYKSNTKIIDTLFHLKNQVNADNIKWEVLIVDYFSDDKLELTVEKVWQNFNIPITIDYIYESGKTPALERGLLLSKGEAICIIDDDNHVDKNYINIAHRLISNNENIGVIGAFGLPKSDINLPSWFYDYQDYFAVGHQNNKSGFLINDSKKWFWGAGSVIRKVAWEKAKSNGFNPIFNPSRASNNLNFENGFSGGEDPELCYAIQLAGYKLWYEPTLVYHHFIPANRLSFNYIENTIKGTAKSQVILRIYSAFLLDTIKARSAIKYFIYTNWHAHFIYIKLKIFFDSIGQNENNLNLLSLNLQLSALSELKNNYRFLVKSIKKLNV